MMTRAELEKWLGELREDAVVLADIAEILHIIVDASRRSVAIADADQLRELRFALAVLRDVFPDDAGVRSWLRAPASDIDGLAPADLLAMGRIGDFADLTVAEWNRPRVPARARSPAVLAPA